MSENNIVNSNAEGQEPTAIAEVAATSNIPVEPAVPNWFDVETWLDAGVLFRADTLAALADQIGVPPETLCSTVDEFNGFALSGVDKHFHRGETPWDRVVSRLIVPHADGPNVCLGVIDSGPFYAVQVVVTDLGTKGGLTTDADARVVRPDGSVIRGLYASGNSMAPMTGRVYPGAGGPIASAMTFSYLAALDMHTQRAETEE